jgi:hypothetical protein
MLNNLSVALACLLVVLSSSFMLTQQEKTTAVAKPNLGFENYTGSGVSADKLAAYINFVNSASVYFRSDVVAKQDYISSQMNTSYGVSGCAYSIIEDDGYFYDWLLVSVNSDLVSVAPGTDRTYPNKSHMYILQKGNISKIRLFLNGDRGFGMTPTLEEVIRNSVINVESGSSYCSCFADKNAQRLAALLKNYDGGSWNTICSDSPTLKASVYAAGEIGIYVV